MPDFLFFLLAFFLIALAIVIGLSVSFALNDTAQKLIKKINKSLDE